jgi:hypothetical protein
MTNTAWSCHLGQNLYKPELENTDLFICDLFNYDVSSLFTECIACL